VLWWDVNTFTVADDVSPRLKPVDCVCGIALAPVSDCLAVSLDLARGSLLEYRRQRQVNTVWLDLVFICLFDVCCDELTTPEHEQDCVKQPEMRAGWKVRWWVW
jgi:hypothetical protein